MSDIFESIPYAFGHINRAAERICLEEKVLEKTREDIRLLSIQQLKDKLSGNMSSDTNLLKEFDITAERILDVKKNLRYERKDSYKGKSLQEELDMLEERLNLIKKMKGG